MKNEGFRKISSTYKKTFSTEDRTRTYVNHNKMLLNYEGCIGVKTGYTQRSGRCLVVAAERNGLEFISVTLDAPNDWSDHTKLLDYGYDTLERINLARVDEYCYNVPIINGDKESILVTNDKDISIIVEKGDHSLNKHIKLIRYAVAPISEGDVLGEIIFTVDGKEVDRCNLIARENAGSNEKKSLLDRLTSLFN